jgi:ABC-type antimicrobial peptide transport system permease subunit
VKRGEVRQGKRAERVTEQLREYQVKDIYGGGQIAYGTIIGTIIAAIIIAASVVVVSNAFRVSAGERTRQFGMLKSVGATKKQIASSVMYEALFLSLAGLPAGLVIGLLVEFIGVTVANGAFQSLYDSGAFAIEISAVRHKLFGLRSGNVEADVQAAGFCGKLSWR